jgi:hypothetical protein
MNDNRNKSFWEKWFFQIVIAPIGTGLTVLTLYNFFYQPPKDENLAKNNTGHLEVNKQVTAPKSIDKSRFNQVAQDMGPGRIKYERVNIVHGPIKSRKPDSNDTRPQIFCTCEIEKVEKDNNSSLRKANLTFKEESGCGVVIDKCRTRIVGHTARVSIFNGVQKYDTVVYDKIFLLPEPITISPNATVRTSMDEKEDVCHMMEQSGILIYQPFKLYHQFTGKDSHGNVFACQTIPYDF